MAEDYWSAEPPWIADLPAPYAAYLRQPHPTEGTRRYPGQIFAVGGEFDAPEDPKRLEPVE